MTQHAPWEKAFDKVVTPFEEFIHHESTSGLLLMGCAVLALFSSRSWMARSAFLKCRKVFQPLGNERPWLTNIAIIQLFSAYLGNLVYINSIY